MKFVGKIHKRVPCLKMLTTYSVVGNLGTCLCTVRKEAKKKEEGGEGRKQLMKPSKFLTTYSLKFYCQKMHCLSKHVGTFMHGFFPSGRNPRSISGVEKRAVL